MESYKNIRDRQQKEYNEFSKDKVFYAFSEEQFKEGLKKLKANKKDIVQFIDGGFIKENDLKDLKELLKGHSQEIEDYITLDKTGEGFIYEMFKYELANHEYKITHDLEDTLKSLNITGEEIELKENLKHGLLKAIKEYEED